MAEPAGEKKRTAADRMAELDALVGRLLEERLRRDKQLAQSASDIEYAQRQFKNFEDQISSMTLQLETRDADMKEAANEIEMLKRRLETTTNVPSGEEEALRARISELERELSEARAQQAPPSESPEEIRRLQTRVSELEGLLTEAQKQQAPSSESAEEIQRLRARINELESEIRKQQEMPPPTMPSDREKELESMVRNLERQLAMESATATAQSEREKEMESKIRDLEMKLALSDQPEQISRLQSENAELQRQLAAEKERPPSPPPIPSPVAEEEAVASANREIEKLREIISELQARCAAVPAAAQEIDMSNVFATEEAKSGRKKKAKKRSTRMKGPRSVEALALGNACDLPEEKPIGCFPTKKEVECDTVDDVKEAACSYKTIAPPADPEAAPQSILYNALDIGSRVRMQLVKALDLYMRGRELVVRNTRFVLDRGLMPLGKVYGQDTLQKLPPTNAPLVVPSNRGCILTTPIDAASVRAKRLIFDVLYGSSVLPSAEKLATIGIDLVPAQKPLNRPSYSIADGPFGQTYRAKAGSIILPEQLIAWSDHVHWNHSLSADGEHYAVRRDESMSDDVKASEGRKLLAMAVRHLRNAAADYVKYKYTNEYGEVPAGAFVMLPRSDVDAVLAFAILMPTIQEGGGMPDFAGIDIGDEEEISKDAEGSAKSRLFAAGMHVLSNYSRESRRIGGNDLPFSQKRKLSRADDVLKEGVDRVAEVLKLVNQVFSQ